MEQRRQPHEFVLDIFTDSEHAKDVVKGILHTILFHRYFSPVRPCTREVLSLSLPCILNKDLDQLLESKTQTLLRQLEPGLQVNTGTSSQGRGDSPTDFGSGDGGPRGQICVQFFEKTSRKTWFGKQDEEVCWEVWTLDVTIAKPRTETDRIKIGRAMEAMLSKTVMKIVTTVDREKDHIPPIRQNETNPFPYQININPKVEGWGQRVGVF